MKAVQIVLYLIWIALVVLSLIVQWHDLAAVLTLGGGHG